MFFILFYMAIFAYLPLFHSLCVFCLGSFRFNFTTILLHVDVIRVVSSRGVVFYFSILF